MRELALRYLAEQIFITLYQSK